MFRARFKSSLTILFRKHCTLGEIKCNGTFGHLQQSESGQNTQTINYLCLEASLLKCLCQKYKTVHLLSPRTNTNSWRPACVYYKAANKHQCCYQKSKDGPCNVAFYYNKSIRNWTYFLSYTHFTPLRC